MELRFKTDAETGPMMNLRRCLQMAYEQICVRLRHRPRQRRSLGFLDHCEVFQSRQLLSAAVLLLSGTLTTQDTNGGEMNDLTRLGQQVLSKNAVAEVGQRQEPEDELSNGVVMRLKGAIRSWPGLGRVPNHASADSQTVPRSWSLPDGELAEATVVADALARLCRVPDLFGD